MAAPLPPALFVAAHPDDELLGMGVAIAEHVAAGRDTHVLWLTDGGNTTARNAINGVGTSAWWGVVHDPAAEGYTPLTVEDCAAARVRESDTAAAVLASPGTVTTHRAGLTSQSLTQTFDQEQAQAAVLAVCDAIAPGGPVHLKGHSHLVDNHPDHLAVGGAVKALAAGDPARFPAVRYYVLPQYWADPRLSQVAASFDLPTDAGIAARVRNAARAYGAWAPQQGVFAVGYHSVNSLLDTVMATPKCLFHT